MPVSDAVLPRSLGLGAVAGMRSMLAPALVSRALAPAGTRPAREPARSLASPFARRVLPLLAAGELVADKLPVTPDRTHPPSVAARVLSGALAGAALATSRRHSAGPAAVAGGVAALAATFAMHRLRKAAARRLAVPDVWVALAEDALALALGRAMLRGTGTARERT